MDYYPKLLCAVPFSPVTGARLLGDRAAAARLLDQLTAELDAQGHSSLHVNFTEPDADAIFQNRDGWLERIGCQFHWHNRGYRDFQDFLDALTSRKRKQLRKEREQVVGQGIEFEWREGHKVSEAEWDFVYACYANTYHVRGQAPYLTRSFFSLLAERMPEAIRVVLACQSGRPVAMAFSLIGAGELYGRYWGSMEFIPGLHFETCYLQSIAYCIEKGIESFEGGAQGEHKLSRGLLPVKTWSAHWVGEPGFAKAIARFLDEETQAIDHYAQTLSAHSPFRKNT
ncbi:MAG TPA: GNAT family N-acetyltransferase [Pusillimonas sp.]|nr:GNAT family N-acetyltransferase [Pusillimonas sp.]